MSNEVQNNICRSQTIERLSDRLLEHDLSKPDGTPRKLMKGLTQRRNYSVTRRSRLVATPRNVASLLSQPEPQ
jgi:hypothetical protein